MAQNVQKTEERIIENVTPLSNTREGLSDSNITTLLTTKENNYAMVLQNSVTNAFSVITSKTNAAINPKRQQGVITAINGNTILETTINQYDTLTLSQSTNKLFMILAIEYTGKNYKNEIVIPLQKYMAMTGNNDPRNAKRQVLSDLTALLNTSFTATKRSNDGTMVPDAVGINILSDYEVRDKLIIARLHDNLIKIFNKGSLMAFPLTLLSLKSSANKNPYSLSLGYKVAVTLKLNMYDHRKKETKDFSIISVESLLNVCANAGMQTYEELQTKNKLQAKMKKLPPETIIEIALGNIPQELLEMIPANLKKYSTKIIQDLISTKEDKDGKKIRKVTQTNFRDLKKLIIEPFFKDLDYCCANTDFFEWELCDANGEPLSDEELGKDYSYKEFISYKIRLTPNPDYKRADWDAKTLKDSHKRKAIETNKKKKKPKSPSV